MKLRRRSGRHFLHARLLSASLDSSVDRLARHPRRSIDNSPAPTDRVQKRSVVSPADRRPIAERLKSAVRDEHDPLFVALARRGSCRPPNRRRRSRSTRLRFAHPVTQRKDRSVTSTRGRSIVARCEQRREFAPIDVPTGRERSNPHARHVRAASHFFVAHQPAPPRRPENSTNSGKASFAVRRAQRSANSRKNATWACQAMPCKRCDPAELVVDADGAFGVAQHAPTHRRDCESTSGGCWRIRLPNTRAPDSAQRFGSMKSGGVVVASFVHETLRRSAH